jgi:type II secretory pathway pseudopilin PulG
MRLQKGSTIIEVLIYLLIFVVLSGVIIYSYSISNNSFKEVVARRYLISVGTKTMERFTREIRKSESINTASSTFGTNPGVLVLNQANSKIVRFDVSGNSINLTENGVLSGNILSSKLSLSSLIFRKITTATGEGVKIELQTSINGGNGLITENFYQTVSLRGNY